VEGHLLVDFVGNARPPANPVEERHEPFSLVKRAANSRIGQNVAQKQPSLSRPQ
jgi:hypothetical protein